MSPGRFGVYVHFPYCSFQCPYCDFAVAVEREVPGRRYADAILAELALRAPAFQGLACETLYLGGGTPSLWEPEEVGRVIAAVRRRFALPAGAELTLEANPESSRDPGRLRGYRAAGVNRLSVGVQSFDRVVLAKLGRRHDPAIAEEAVRQAAAVFENVCLDLIYGGRTSTPATARADAERAAGLPITHLSAYALTLDVLAVDVPLARLSREGRLRFPSDDASLAQARAIRGALRRGGLARYEISNFARRGFESRHNALYWEGASYLGLGVGAYGFRGEAERGMRYGNFRAPEAWFAAVQGGRLPTAEEDLLDAGALTRERIMLALRTRAGVPESLLPEGKRGEVGALLAAGLARRVRGRLVLTARGLDVHSAVAERFF
jgi:oxygen-independent coproporphyrinogen-3 oxidase